MAGVVLASGGGKHRARLVRRLRADGATSVSSARPLELKNPFDRRGLESALRCGVIKRADGDTYYVDEERAAEVRTRELRFLLIALLAMAMLFGILFILGEFP
jgi:hypothetical protein